MKLLMGHICSDEVETSVLRLTNGLNLGRVSKGTGLIDNLLVNNQLVHYVGRVFEEDVVGRGDSKGRHERDASITEEVREVHKGGRVEGSCREIEQSALTIDRRVDFIVNRLGRFAVEHKVAHRVVLVSVEVVECVDST